MPEGSDGGRDRGSPEGLRNGFGLTRPSEEGGFEEFFESMSGCPRNSAFSARNSAISTRAAGNSARNSPTIDTSSA
jgi:hypothetical protein